MRLASLIVDGKPRLAARRGDGYVDLSGVDPSLGADVGALLASGPDWRLRAARALAAAAPVEGDGIRYRPLVPRPPKILCLGLNDYDHAAEAGMAVPEVPVVFSRVASSLIGHREPMVRPVESDMLDYEVELAVIIGRGGRRIARADALEHVAGYAVFNDGSVRDFQVRTPQWMLGKNFHGTGALGPELVTPDELPAGAAGLAMSTHVGDEQLQRGDTGRFIFDVASTVALLSEVMLLEPGDVIAMGTPAGIGFARTPQRFLVPGEVCRAGIEGVGELVNPVIDDPARAAVDPSNQRQSGGA